MSVTKFMEYVPRFPKADADMDSRDVLSKELLIRIAEQLKAGEIPGTSHGEYVFIKEYQVPAEMAQQIPKNPFDRVRHADGSVTEFETLADLASFLGVDIPSGTRLDVQANMDYASQRAVPIEQLSACGMSAEMAQLYEDGFTLEQQKEIEAQLNKHGWAVYYPLSAHAAERLEALDKAKYEAMKTKPVDIMAETRKMLR